MPGGVYDGWLKEAKDKYLHPDDVRRRTDEYLNSTHHPNTDRFVRDTRSDIGVRERILDVAPLYITPSRLYDNPDYRDMRRKSNTI